MKTSLLAGLALMALGANAQNLPQHPKINYDDLTQQEQKAKHREFQARITPNASHKSGASLSQRMSHSDIAYYLFGPSLKFVYSPFAPDSIYTQIFGTPSSIETHGFGQVFDPTSPGFSTTGKEYLAPQDSYQIDTIYVGVRYRTSSPLSGYTGDTLLVTVFSGDTSDNSVWRVGIGYNAGTFYGLNHREEVLPPRYTGNPSVGVEGSIDAPNKMIIKYALKAEDTATAYLKIAPPNPIQVPAGYKFGIHCSYKPYQSYDPATQVYYRSGGKGDVNNMSWLYLTSKTSADNNAYFLESFNLGAPSAALSTVLFTGTRYHSWTGSQAFRNEYVSPTVTNGNLVDFWITATSSVGNNENSLASISDPYPNPSNGILNIDLAEEGEYTLTLCNSIGQEVYSEKINLNSSASIRRDLSHLSAGPYFLWIQHKDDRITGMWNKK